MQPRQPRRKKPTPAPQFHNLNAFKSQQKHYKLYQGIQTDFSTLYAPAQDSFVQVGGYWVCELPFPDGAYYVKDFVGYETVAEIGYQALNCYCRRPYRTNLDSRNELYEGQQEKGQGELGQGGQQMVQMQKESQPEGRKQQRMISEHRGYYFNEKIRWANVGMQYDWTLRTYPALKTPMPPSIQALSDRANQLYRLIEHSDRQYQPQSAIINYYGPKDYMTGHLDDAEIDQQSPIYSFSFGLSCIFLMGGRTKDDKPTAIRLNSGDLLIMASQARKCYHGVPRILEGSFRDPSPQDEATAKQLVSTLEQKQSQLRQDHNNYDSIHRYFSGHRININIRQVHPNK